MDIHDAHIHRSFIHNLGVVKMSFNKQVGKWTSIHYSNEILFSANKACLSSLLKDGVLNTYCWRREANLKTLHVFGSSCVTFQEMQNHRDSKMTSFQVLQSRARMNEYAEHGGFRVGKLFWVITQWGIYVFVHLYNPQNAQEYTILTIKKHPCLDT